MTQVAGPERRTRSGGRDVIDHPPGGHDDVANVLAGVCDAVMNRRQVAGIVGVDGTGGMNTDASGDWVLPGDPRSPKTNSTAYELAMREFEIEREEHAREQRLFALAARRPRAVQGVDEAEHEPSFVSFRPTTERTDR